jgi:hypothetical protein
MLGDGADQLFQKTNPFLGGVGSFVTLFGVVVFGR